MAPHERAPMTTRPDGTFLTRVRLRNYKSIAECDVKLGPLTFLVGPNGSGKSNFLDALRFVRDVMVGGVAWALEQRGGITEVVRRSRRPEDSFAIELEFTTRDGVVCEYALEVAYRGVRSTGIQRESVSVLQPGASTPWRPEPYDDSAGIEALRNQAGLSQVVVQWGAHASVVHEALRSMSFYNPEPRAIRPLQALNVAPNGLTWDGSNLGSVLLDLEQRDPELWRRVNEYMHAVLPSVTGIRGLAVGEAPSQWATVQFSEDRPGSDIPNTFVARNMSDGTLRALALITALMRNTGVQASALVGIEEPETALHPGAGAVILDAMRAASRSMQVVATTHSTDMLDDKHFLPEQLLAVSAEYGRTRIGPVDDVDRDALKRRMFTAGELLRMNALRLGDAGLDRADRVADSDA